MFGEVADALAEERDLHFGGSGIAFVGLVRADDFGLAFLTEHDGSFHARSRHRRGMRRTGPPLAVFLDGSVFYLSTSRGCKSPSGRPSATDRTSPLASRTLTRSPDRTADATAR